MPIHPYMFVSGGISRIQVAPNAGALHMFGEYDNDNIASVDITNIDINQISASSPTPFGNISLIKRALDTAVDKAQNNTIGDSHVNFLVLNKWMDFWEYVCAKKEKLEFRVFDFSVKLKNYIKLQEKFTNVGFEKDSVYVLIYEKTDKKNGKSKLIGGVCKEVLFFPISQNFTRFNDDTGRVEVGQNSINQVAYVYEKDKNELRKFSDRSKDFYDIVNSICGSPQNVDLFWHGLKKYLNNILSPQDQNSASSFIDIFHYYFRAINKTEDNNLLREFVEKSVDFLKDNPNIYRLFTETQRLNSFVYEDGGANGGKLCIKLMRINVPKGCELNKDYFDVLTYEHDKNSEYFLYPLQGGNDQDDFKNLKIAKISDGKYFLTFNSKFRIYEPEKVLVSPPFFLNVVPDLGEEFKCQVLILSNGLKFEQICKGWNIKLSGNDNGYLFNCSEGKTRFYEFDGNPKCIQLSLIDDNNNKFEIGCVNYKCDIKPLNDNKVSVAIDLGTSNTYVCYRKQSESDSSTLKDSNIEFVFSDNQIIHMLVKFGSEPNKSQIELLDASNDESPDIFMVNNFKDIYRILFPLDMRSDYQNKLPSFSALLRSSSNKPNSPEYSYRFGYEYVNDVEALLEKSKDYYLTEFKWDTKSDIYKQCISLLQDFVKRYLRIKEGINPQNISWVLTQPQIILNKEIFKVDGVETVDEALAPLALDRYNGNNDGDDLILLSIDIGGGTVDFGIMHNKKNSNSTEKKYFKTSALFGFNKLIDEFPFGESNNEKNIWADLLDSNNRKNYKQLIKPFISKNGLSSVSGSNDYAKFKKIFLVYYIAIVWHSAEFLKLIFKEQYKVVKERIIIQLSGQGSGFFDLLFVSRGRGQEEGAFIEYDDSSSLSKFHTKIFSIVFGDSIEFNPNKFVIRRLIGNHPKSITSIGALQFVKHDDCNNNVDPKLVANGRIVDLAASFNDYTDLIDDNLTGLFSILEDKDLKIISQNLTGVQFEQREIDNFKINSKDFINQIRDFLQYNRGKDIWNNYLGITANSEKGIESSPDLWPVLSIIHNLRKL